MMTCCGVCHVFANSISVNGVPARLRQLSFCSFFFQIYFLVQTVLIFPSFALAPPFSVISVVFVPSSEPCDVIFKFQTIGFADGAYKSAVSRGISVKKEAFARPVCLTSISEPLFPAIILMFIVAPFL